MAATITSYALDACALIAYLRNEIGGEKLRELFKQQGTRILMHSVNLGEVYYDSLRVVGTAQAQELLDEILQLPLHVIWTIDVRMITLLGFYKTSYRISYADAFVLALAQQENALVISTDHHEFDVVEQSGSVRFYWLR